ncbi:hypothetical protein FOA52_005366 [Chlamydomonas sp. UWO 241]|nr:hypothetical protein FOA52_005366 [Chlamydomonas sp. UWO 241]
MRCSSRTATASLGSKRPPRLGQFHVTNVVHGAASQLALSDASCSYPVSASWVPSLHWFSCWGLDHQEARSFFAARALWNLNAATAATIAAAGAIPVLVELLGLGFPLMARVCASKEIELGHSKAKIREIVAAAGGSAYLRWLGV